MQKPMLSCAALLIFVLGAVPASMAQEFPVRPIRVIVPFAPGGPADIGARPVAQMLSTRLGQPIVVVNRGGGAGSIGATEGAKATPDGYTVVYTASSFALAPLVYKKLSYDPIKDFSPIILTQTQPMVLVVNAKTPVKTVPQLIAYVKENPSKLAYGSSGSGGITHLVSAEFASRFELSMTHVAYKGSGPGVVDLVGGQIHMMLTSIGTVRPHIDSGRLRALAISSTERSPALPDTPTLSEASKQDYPEFGVWQGILAPAGTQPKIVALLNRHVNEILKEPEYSKRVVAQGSVLLGGTPNAFQAYMKNEIARWGKVVKETGIQPLD